MKLSEGGAEKVVKSRHSLPPGTGGAAGTAGRAGAGDFSCVFKSLVQRHDPPFLFYNKTGYEIIFSRDRQEQIGNIFKRPTTGIK